MSEVKILVIVPFYNTKEEFLFQCITSIINQTYDNIEIILVNDGSNKNYFDFFEKFQSQVIIINKENQGVSVARNDGINKASGDYILFVDSDDWLEIDACEKLVDILKREKDTEIILSKCYINNSIYVKENISFYESDMIIKNKSELYDSIFLTENIKFTCIDTPWAKLYKKDFLNNNNIRFKENLKNGEDVVLNYEAFSKAKNIYFTVEKTYNYRINEYSVCNSYSDDLDKRFIDLIEEFSFVVYSINYTAEYEKFNLYIVRILCRLLRKFYIKCNNYFEFKVKFKVLLSNKTVNKALNTISYKKMNLGRKIVVLLYRKKLLFVIYAIIRMNIKIK